MRCARRCPLLLGPIIAIASILVAVIFYFINSIVVYTLYRKSSLCWSLVCVGHGLVTLVLFPWLKGIRAIPPGTLWRDITLVKDLLRRGQLLSRKDSLSMSQDISFSMTSKKRTTTLMGKMAGPNVSFIRGSS